MKHPEGDPVEWTALERLVFLRNAFGEYFADAAVLRMRLTEKGYAWILHNGEPGTGYNFTIYGPGGSRKNNFMDAWRHFDTSEKRAVVIATCRMLVDKEEK